MPESLKKPIVDVLLKENENLALVFPVTGLKEFDLYFFRILRRYPLHRVYDSTEMPSISAGSTQDFGYLGDTGIGSGDNTLEMWRERPFRILHFGIGISPEEIGFYKSQPADTPETGFSYETPTKVGDKFDFITGDLSPYEEPTVFSETILYYKMSLHLGFINRADRDITPILRILGAGYDTIQITSRNFIDKILAGIKPCRFVTIGGLRVFTYSVPESWEKPTRVDKATIERLMGGGA